jgi:hypothetical protein
MTFLMLMFGFSDDGFSDFQILEFKIELKIFGTQIKKI